MRSPDLSPHFLFETPAEVDFYSYRPRDLTLRASQVASLGALRASTTDRTNCVLPTKNCCAAISIDSIYPGNRL